MVMILEWWHIPTVASVLLFAWCFFHEESPGHFPGMETAFCGMLALIVSVVLWLAFAVAKIMGAF